MPYQLPVDQYASEEQFVPYDAAYDTYDGGDGDCGSSAKKDRKLPWTWKEYPWSIDLPIWLAPKATNPGSQDHPNCRPCAFVFRLAGDCVRLRCANAETCEFCHDPSHPRYRGRHSRRKSRRMRADRQYQDSLDQEEQQEDADSSNGSSSRAKFETDHRGPPLLGLEVQQKDARSNFG